MANEKRIAYEHRDIEDVIRFLDTLPHGQVARFVHLLARRGVEVTVTEAPTQPSPQETP